jgi:hypothetical protein
MKPIKNRVFCRDCGKAKMLFEDEKKANTFIKFNSKEILLNNGYSPCKSYFCIYCNGWHVSSKISKKNNISHTEKVIKLYNNQKIREQKVKQDRKEAKLQNLKYLTESLDQIDGIINKIKILIENKEFDYCIPLIDFVSNELSKNESNPSLKKRRNSLIETIQKLKVDLFGMGKI